MGCVKFSCPLLRRACCCCLVADLTVNLLTLAPGCGEALLLAHHIGDGERLVPALLPRLILALLAGLIPALLLGHGAAHLPGLVPALLAWLVPALAVGVTDLLGDFGALLLHNGGADLLHGCAAPVPHCAEADISKVVLHWRRVSVRVVGTCTVLQSVAGSSQHFSSQTVLQMGLRTWNPAEVVRAATRRPSSAEICKKKGHKGNFPIK